LYIAELDSINALNSTGKVREEFIFTEETKSKQSIIQYKYAVCTGGKGFHDMTKSNAFHVTEV